MNMKNFMLLHFCFLNAAKQVDIFNLERFGTNFFYWLQQSSMYPFKLFPVEFIQHAKQTQYIVGCLHNHKTHIALMLQTGSLTMEISPNETNIEG